MDRLACVDVPAFPLQLLLRQHPEWAGLPAAVVDADKPQGQVLWVNRKAREAGVLPGARYGSALSLAPALRAGPIADAAVRAGVLALCDTLRTFSPDVEPSEREPGVFWLDAGGLTPLFCSSEAWAIALRQALDGAGYVGAVVVGFRRFGTYAAAKALRGREAVVFETPASEEAFSREVALSLLGIPPGVREALAQLGVKRVGELLRLPAHGVGRRFGAEALQLHRFASGDLEWPLNPLTPAPRFEERLELDYQEHNAERLVFMVKPLVDRLLASLGAHGQALVELRLSWTLERSNEREAHVRTAEPTLSSVTVMELVRLRLEAEPLGAPVVGVAARATGVPATAEQLRMFAEAAKRDLAAAARAFARLRAAFGDDAVVRAAVRDRHLPEGRFAWEPMTALAPPHPRADAAGMLVRRMLSKPEPLPASSPRDPEGWLLAGPEAGPVTGLSGPYRLTGGWWRTAAERDYYFAELGGGGLLWVYFDRVKGRWFVHGEIS